MMQFQTERISITLKQELSRDDWMEMEKFWPPYLKSIELKDDLSRDVATWPPFYTNLKPYGDDGPFDNPFRTLRTIMIRTDPMGTEIRPIPK